jgi:hypothetical protein
MKVLKTVFLSTVLSISAPFASGLQDAPGADSGDGQAAGTPVLSQQAAAEARLRALDATAEALRGDGEAAAALAELDAFEKHPDTFHFYKDSARELRARLADPNSDLDQQLEDSPFSPASFAAENKMFNTFKVLAKRGAQLLDSASRPTLPLYLAATHFTPAQFRELLPMARAQGFHINFTDCCGQTILYYVLGQWGAGADSTLPMVQLLIEEGAETDAPVHSPLRRVIFNNHLIDFIAIIELLAQRFTSDQIEARRDELALYAAARAAIDVEAVDAERVEAALAALANLAEAVRAREAAERRAYVADKIDE